MEDIRALVRGLEDADADKLVNDIPIIMQKIKGVGFVEVVRDDELKDFLPIMRERMGDVDVDKLIPVAKVLMPTFFEGLADLIDASEEAKEELEDMEDMSIQLSVPDIDVYLYMVLKDKKFTAGIGKIDDAELRLTMNKEVFLEQMKGEGSLVNAYMAGAVSLEGPLNKAMAMNTLFEVIADEYDLDIGFG